MKIETRATYGTKSTTTGITEVADRGRVKGSGSQEEKDCMKKCKTLRKTGELQDSNLMSTYNPRNNGGQHFLNQNKRLLKCFAGGGKHIKLSTLF